MCTVYIYTIFAIDSKSDHVKQEVVKDGSKQQPDEISSSLFDILDQALLILTVGSQNDALSEDNKVLFRNKQARKGVFIRKSLNVDSGKDDVYIVDQKCNLCELDAERQPKSI